MLFQILTLFSLFNSCKEMLHEKREKVCDSNEFNLMERAQTHFLQKSTVKRRGYLMPLFSSYYFLDDEKVHTLYKYRPKG